MIAGGWPRGSATTPARADGAQLAELAGRIDRGQLTATIDRVFPMASWAEAFALQESGKARGKLVLAIA